MKLLHEVTFVSFLEKLQAAIQEGYTVDFENSDTYPRQFGFNFMVNLVNADDLPERKKAQEAAAKEAEEAKDKEAEAAEKSKAQESASPDQAPIAENTAQPAAEPKKRGPKPKA